MKKLIIGFSIIILCVVILTPYSSTQAALEYHPADLDKNWRISDSESVLYIRTQQPSYVDGNRVRDIVSYGGLYGKNSINGVFSPYHPADTNHDFRISIMEASVYFNGNEDQILKDDLSQLFAALGSVTDPLARLYYWHASIRQWGVAVKNTPRNASVRVISSSAQVVSIPINRTSEDATILGSFKVELQNGTDEGFRLISPNTFSVVALPQGETGAAAYLPSKYHTMQVVIDGKTVTDADEYRLITGKAIVDVRFAFNTRYMFSGVYAIKLGNVYHGTGYAAILGEPVAVSAKPLVIFGEKFAQIHRVVGTGSSYTPGDTITIVGDRFNNGDNKIHFVEWNGTRYVDVANLTARSTPDGKQIKLNLPTRTVFGSRRSIGIQVQNPNTPTGEYYNYGRSNVYSIQFIDNLINVVYPNGGETLTNGVKSNIAWLQYFGPNSTASFDIFLVGLSSGNNYLIRQGVPAQSGTLRNSIEWTPKLPYEKDTQFTVKVCQSGTIKCDSSDSYFKIGDTNTIQPSITSVSSKGGGEGEIYAGTPVYISGVSLLGGADTSYRTTIYIGNSVCPITGGNNNQLTCTASSNLVAGNKYDLYITKDGRTSNRVPVTVLSNLPTPVPTTPSITVISPNGGEVWTAGTAQTIRWQASNFPSGSTVYVELRSASAYYISPRKIAVVAPSIGYYSWLIPSDIPSGSYMIEVYKANQYGIIDQSEGAKDISDAHFTIMPPLSPVTPTVNLAPTFSYDQDGVIHRLFVKFGASGGKINSIKQISPAGTCYSLNASVAVASKPAYSGIPNCSLGGGSYGANSSCGVYLQKTTNQVNPCVIAVEYQGGLTSRVTQFESYLPAGASVNTGERIRQLSTDTAKAAPTQSQVAQVINVLQVLLNLLSGR